MGEYLYQEITKKIIGAAFEVHNALGKGLREKTYENALALKLRELGLAVEQQKRLPVFFQNQKTGDQEVDLLVEEKIIVENKGPSSTSFVAHSPGLGLLEEYKIPAGPIVELWAQGRNQTTHPHFSQSLAPFSSY